MLLLITHIIIALSSLGISTVGLFAPSQLLLRASYGLAFATVTTGTALIILHPSHLVASCVTGIVYLALATGLTLGERVRLKRLAVSVQ